MYADTCDISNTTPCHTSLPTPLLPKSLLIYCMQSCHDSLSVHDASDSRNALLAGDYIGNGVGNLELLENSAETGTISV